MRGREPEIIVLPRGAQIIPHRKQEMMKYYRYGPYKMGGALNAEFMNKLEDFLCLLPSECRYQRYGPFYNGSGPGLNASLFNGIERFLEHVEVEHSYRSLGPFLNGDRISVHTILDHIEEYLASLGDIPKKRDLTPLQPLGSREPLGWMDRQGEFIRNPDYIEPAKRPEPVQYGQCLVEYDYGR